MPNIFDNDMTDSFFNNEAGAALFSLFPQAAGTNRFAEFLRGRVNPLYTQYQSMLPNDPNLSFRNFLGGQDLQGQFNALAPSQRGLDLGRFAPRVQYRSRFGG